MDASQEIDAIEEDTTEEEIIQTDEEVEEVGKVKLKKMTGYQEYLRSVSVSNYDIMLKCLS